MKKKIVVNPKRVTASEGAPQEYTTEEELLAAGYEALQINHKSAGKNYCLYRKMVNGKGDWYASDWNTRENVQHITYAQARGLEDINPTPVSRLGRELGKKLLPQTHVQSATEASGNLDVEAAMEYATGQIRHLCKQMGSRKVAEIDIDDIQLGPDNFSFDVILYNAQGNAWSKDTFATSIHPVDGKSRDMDDVQWVIDQKTDEFVYNMIHNPVKPTRPAFGSKSVKASSEVKRTFIVQQYMKEEDENGPKFEKVHEADTHEAADEWLQKHLGETESQPSEFRIIQCSTITPKNAGLTSTVQKMINDKVIEIMQTDSFGFPADEAAEYSRVEVTEADHSYLRVEVRVELSYDSMWEMKELLDPIISKMDQDAYFDMDEPGIMSAYVNINKLKAWGKDLANITGSESLTADSGCTMIITVDQGLNADGFAVSITDSLGQEVFKSNYMYGYNASWDKGWSSSDKPYTTDIIEDLCSQYDVSNVEVVPGKNTFRGDDVRQDSVDRFKQNYLSHMSGLSGPSSVTSASRPRYVYDPRIEPDDDYVEGDDYEEVLEVEVSTVVDFDEDGDTEYRDTSWARNPDRKDGDWHDDNGVYLADPGRVIEEFDDLMKKSPDCPDGPGTYKVSGILRMKFIVTGITLDEDSYEQEMVENYEGADADYDAKGSSIENLTFAEQTTVESATTAGSENRRIRHEPLAHGYFLNEYTSGQISITKPRPYDDADYYWAHWDEPRKSWAICKSSMVVKYISEDDIDEPDDIAEELEMVNAGIKPKMMHN